MGGAWERMIWLVRKILKRFNLVQTLTKEGIITLKTEVEGILNFTPLVRLMLHDSEEESLTFNHLLMLRGNLYLPPGTYDTYTVAVTRAGVGSSTDSCQSILAVLGQRNFSQSFAAAKTVQSREEF